jgi:hypothetical protein
MPSTTPPRAVLFEENALAFLLLFLGLLGIAVGIISPRDHATELVLGVGLGGLGAWTLWRNRERHSS